MDEAPCEPKRAGDKEHDRWREKKEPGKKQGTEEAVGVSRDHYLPDDPDTKAE